MIQRITRQNRRHIRHHFISIPRPSDADQDSEFYWPLDETGRKRRIQFIEKYLKSLKMDVIEMMDQIGNQNNLQFLFQLIIP